MIVQKNKYMINSKLEAINGDLEGSSLEIKARKEER